MFIHANLTPPIKAYVREDVLYDMDATRSNNYIECLIISVASYAGHVPTFTIIVSGESIFSYVPPHLLSIHNYILNSYLPSDLTYHNCPSNIFTLSKFNHFNKKNIKVFLKDKKIWETGKYLFTIDWYRGNDLLNCMALSNGQLGFFPNHKLSLGKGNMPAYKKLHQEWKL